MPTMSGRWAAHRAQAAAVNDSLARADPPSRLDLADRNAQLAVSNRLRLPLQRGCPEAESTGSDTVSTMLIAFSVAPSGVGESGVTDPSGSVSEAVAEAVRVVRESGLPNSTDAMFTTVEGDWDECMAVVKKACGVVGRYGSRVSLVLKADIRPGWHGQITAKVDRVENRLRSDSGSDTAADTAADSTGSSAETE